MSECSLGGREGAIRAVVLMDNVFSPGIFGRGTGRAAVCYYLFCVLFYFIAFLERCLVRNDRFEF